MSWRIAADAREMFFDLVALSPSGESVHFARALNRKDNLLFGLGETLNLLPSEVKSAVQGGEASLSFVTDYQRVAVREKWGAKAALVGTEGFESLLTIGNQQRLNPFGLRATKKNPVISSDFSFGLTERTHSNGEIEKTPADEEIETLVSKLQLAEVQNVALCFLHSKKNPKNEKHVGEKLKGFGFKVFYSHEEEGHELERAEKASIKAILESGYREMLEKLEGLGFNKDNIFLKPERPHLTLRAPKNTLAVEILEDRILVSSESLHFQEIRTSPLNAVELDPGGLAHVGPYKIEPEPGPVIFGKGIHLTALDLMAINGGMSASDIPRLKVDPTRVTRQLAPLAQNLRIDLDSCCKSFIDLFEENMALDIQNNLNESPPVLTVAGWLAPLFAKSLAHRLKVKKVFVPPHCGWTTPLRLLETELSDKIKMTKMGWLEESFTSRLAEGKFYDL